MTLRSSDLQSVSDLDSIRNSCDVFNNCIEKSQNKTLLKKALLNPPPLPLEMFRVTVENRWFFGKGPNGIWPSPTPQNGPFLWKSCACISYYLALIPICIYATIYSAASFWRLWIHYKKVGTLLSENEGGGQRQFDIFLNIHLFCYPDPSPTGIWLEHLWR